MERVDYIEAATWLPPDLSFGDMVQIRRGVPDGRSSDGCQMSELGSLLHSGVRFKTEGSRREILGVSSRMGLREPMSGSYGGRVACSIKAHQWRWTCRRMTMGGVVSSE